MKIATESDHRYAKIISDQISESAKSDAIGIAMRSLLYVEKQMSEGNAIIAFNEGNGEPAGFCYIQSWDEGRYCTNSGLIVFPQYRKSGLARQIKLKAFYLSRAKYPEAKLFGLTTSGAVMKINSEFAYRPTTFSELTRDDQFWQGCRTCVNHEVLQSKERKNCLCTAMIFYPADQKKQV